MPGAKGGSGGGAAGQGGVAGTGGFGGTTGSAGTSGSDCGPPPPIAPCRVGRTVVECVTDAMGSHWSVSCPDEQTDAGGAGGAGGGTPCASTAGCAMGEVCTTEDGVCDAPPGCGPGVACPAVCYGSCRSAGDGPACGATRCASGMVCCNATCGTCVPPNGACTQQICEPPTAGGACMRDGDCRLEADYCTGCDCRALATDQMLPACPGPGVRCLRDPCSTATAACVNGRCVMRWQ